ncbi:MAG: hypothetical protein K0T99_02035 [Alphaproteobacteria bacterium]|nr:hypothetical protein [Alphaproteobacteria bacterium]
MKNKSAQLKNNLGNVYIVLSRFLKRQNTITHRLGENPVAMHQRALWR